MKKIPYILLIIIILIGLYLRFDRIESSFKFGWDQARDSWKVRDILVKHQLVLNGPRTGIGHFHLGPLYYYLLVPFYFVTKLDPKAANYFNIVANVFNFIVIYWVIKKIISHKTALFAVSIFALNHFMILYGRIPWNVSLVPAVAYLIFYCLYKAMTGSYRYYTIGFFFIGLFFHLHFTAVIFALIVPLTLIFVKDKKSALFSCIKGIPFLFIWLLPVIIYNFQSYQYEYFKYKEFIGIYLLSFHFRFFLHRLPDALLQFEFLLYFKEIKWLTFVLPILLLVFLFKEKNKEKKSLGILALLWIFGVWFGFTLYGGPLTDYYFLLTLPAVVTILILVQKKLYTVNPRIFGLLLGIFWIFYASQSLKAHSVNTSEGGLTAQRLDSYAKIRGKETVPFSEGDITSYFYSIWNEDGKEFWK